MFNSIKLTLYTQEDCYYCYEMKKKLVEWGYDFREVNLSYDLFAKDFFCLLYTSPSPRDISGSRMPSSA